MKILVLSLLRMGDLIMQKQALQALKLKYPDSEIHLLTNRSNAGLIKALPEVSKAHFFDREKIQNSLGSAESSFFEATDRCLDLVRRLNQASFDLLINLTHNRLSAHLMGLIDADEKLGLEIDELGQSHMNSPWFRYLNDYTLSGAKEQLHLTDVFSSCVTNAQEFKDSPHNKFEKKINPSIAIQPWSSEDKKNWSDAQWIEFIIKLNIYMPEHRLLITHGPENLNRFEALNEKLKAQSIRVESVCKSIAQLSEEFEDNCELLVSVDTGIKHLAAVYNVRILELTFGGSDFEKTGAYQNDALIIAPRVQCYPCPVGKPCERAQQDCAIQLDPQFVASMAFEQLRGQWVNIQNLAEEYSDIAQTYRVHLVPGVGFHAVPMGQVVLSQVLDAVLNKMSRISVLNNSRQGDIGQFGTMSLQLRKLVARLSHFDPGFSLDTYFRSVEIRINKIEVLTGKVRDLITKDMRTWTHQSGKSLILADETKQAIELLGSDLMLGTYLNQFAKEPSFYSMRRLMNILDEIQATQKTLWKIIRTFVGGQQLDLT